MLASKKNCSFTSVNRLLLFKTV